MGKSYMEGVSLLEILIWVSPNKSDGSPHYGRPHR
jgi:hypothetical protein